MTISENILSLLQAQFQHETANYLRYTARASWARYKGFEATADFFTREAKGEHGHAKIVREYIEARNEAVKPEGLVFNNSSDFKFFDELFTTALLVEQDTTEKLNYIYAEAQKIGDYMTVVWVQKLIAEQIEEENLYTTIIDRMAQRGGYGYVGPDSEGFELFRKDPSAAHDIDMFLGEVFSK